MPEEFIPPQLLNELTMRIRDTDEKQRLLKERVILIGENVVSLRDEFTKELQDLKKATFVLKEESERMKELFSQVAEQLNNTARKEELRMVERQMEMLKPLLA